MPASDPVPPSFDAWLPPDMALKAEAVGVKKATLDATTTLVLAILAGAFISLGAVFATTVTTGAAQSGLSFGLTKLAGGVVFSLGLILVVIAGAELFTGNNLIVMARASGRISSGQLLRNWVLVYVGNFIGALGTVALVFLAGHHRLAKGAVGVNALEIARAKCSLGFTQALALGILCNALVCLAVWLCFSARTVTDKILAILFPISAFVACGFEHSVANMYFVPMGILIREKASAAFWRDAHALGVSGLGKVNAETFLTANLLPVTIGNVIGGALLVGAVYWVVYRRGQQS